MMNLLKILIGLFLTSLVISSTGCCAFCKIDTTTEYVIDTIYYPDTIQVEVVDPIMEIDSITVFIPVPDEVIDSIVKSRIDSIEYDTIEYDNIKYTTFAGGGTGINWRAYLDSSDMYMIMDDMSVYEISPYDTLWVRSNYASGYAYLNGYGDMIMAIFDNDNIDAVVDSLYYIISTQANTIIKTREPSKKFKKYRRFTWLFGFILLVIAVYALKPFVESLFNRDK